MNKGSEGCDTAGWPSRVKSSPRERQSADVSQEAAPAEGVAAAANGNDAVSAAADEVTAVPHAEEVAVGAVAVQEGPDITPEGDVPKDAANQRPDAMAGNSPGDLSPSFTVPYVHEGPVHVYNDATGALHGFPTSSTRR